MVVDNIVNFVSYLNNNGYTISQDKISGFFKSMNIASFTEEEDLLSMMEIFFCTTPEQCHNLKTYFHAYIINNENIFISKDVEQQKEELFSDYNIKNISLQQRLKDIEQKIDSIRNQAISDSCSKESLFSAADIDFIKTHEDFIRSIKFKEKKNKSFLEECVIGNNPPTNYSRNFINSLANELVKQSEKALKKSQMEDFYNLKAVFNIVKKLEKNYVKNSSKVNNVLSKDAKELFEQKMDIELKIKKAQKEHEQVQRKLDERLYSLNRPEKLILKEQSIINRSEFIGGTGNSVRLLGSGDPVFSTNFDKLSHKDINKILKHIKDNILRFKTRVSRNISTNNRHDIDVKETIQNACKTGGLPFNISYKKPHSNKAKLLLVLDISGSCANASKMMLTFMYLIKSVFPGGCKTFAFVDSLYDISSIMEAPDIDEAIVDVFDTIPVHGVYSNYYIPLKTLWNDYKKEITPETTIIFMGDARNNRNETGEEYLKNISRRAKKAYWINTEDYSQWGVRDSLAREYSKYFKMFEVINTSQLINFIESM